MRKYCEEAASYGDKTIDGIIKPKQVLVLLNPAANKKSAEKMFEEYCKPILNLAGYLVDIVPTDSVGHARRYIEDIEKLPDAIVVAGGDGTVSEAITGLMRRPQHDQCPIGILPVGRTNSIAKRYFNLPDDDEVLGLAQAAIAVVRENSQPKDIIKIQPLAEDEHLDETAVQQQPPKPIYALNSLQWGAYIDAINLRDRYWYFGPLREYAASLFNAFGNKLQWNCEASLTFTPPCSGCRNCYNTEKQISVVVGTGRWWSRFAPKFKLGHQKIGSIQSIDYSKITNENCIKEQSLNINPAEIILSPDADNILPKLTLKTNSEIKSGFEFIQKSWKRIHEDKLNLSENIIEGRTILLKPSHVAKENEPEKFYYIDNEPYEVRPIRISLIPKAVNVFVV